MKWNQCINSSPKICSNISHAIVIYEYKNETTGIKFYNWCEARWNGIEWRTDNIGLSEKKNLFDNPSYTPLMWAVVNKPSEMIVDIGDFSSFWW